MRAIAPPEGNRRLLLLLCQPVGFASIRHAQGGILNFAGLYLVSQHGGMNFMHQGKLLHAYGAWRRLNLQARSGL